MDSGSRFLSFSLRGKRVKTRSAPLAGAAVGFVPARTSQRDVPTTKGKGPREVGTARCAVRSAPLAGAAVGFVPARTSQRDVPTTKGKVPREVGTARCAVRSAPVLGASRDPSRAQRLDLSRRGRRSATSLPQKARYREVGATRRSHAQAGCATEFGALTTGSSAVSFHWKT